MDGVRGHNNMLECHKDRVKRHTNMLLGHKHLLDAVVTCLVAIGGNYKWAKYNSNMLRVGDQGYGVGSLSNMSH